MLAEEEGEKPLVVLPNSPEPPRGPEILRPDQVRIIFGLDSDTARYNVAAIQSIFDPNGILMVVREVPRAGVKEGTPDKGNLHIYRSTTQGIEEVSQLDISHPDIGNWEDTRAYVSPEIIVDAQGHTHEQVRIGLTATRLQDNVPVAATIRGEFVDGVFTLFSDSLEVYLTDEGKNMTPVNDTHFLFRRETLKEGAPQHHLELVTHGRDPRTGKDKLTPVNGIYFEPKTHEEWRIGTLAYPLPGGILPIHRVERFPLGINAEGKIIFGYTYADWLTRVDASFNLIQASEIPFLTRESFKYILPMGIELNDNKDVIYCCGYFVKGDRVTFIMSIGDLMTVAVTKTLGELEDILNTSTLIPTHPSQRRSA